MKNSYKLLEHIKPILMIILLFAGMTAPQAHRHHISELGIENDIFMEANKSINPPLKWVEGFLTEWFTEYSGDSISSQKEKLDQYAFERKEEMILQYGER